MRLHREDQIKGKKKKKSHYERNNTKMEEPNNSNLWTNMNQIFQMLRQHILMHMAPENLKGWQNQISNFLSGYAEF